MASRQRITCVVMALAGLCGVLGTRVAGAAEPADQAGPAFARDVLPILAANCFSCHGFDEHSRQAGLRLDTAAGATAALDSGARAIVPGVPAESELVKRVTATDPDVVMPPPETGRSLSAAERATLARWIAAGATYESHWAFRQPAATTPPEGGGFDHPIDRFLAGGWREAGIDPAPQAPPETLLRRASLDLVGLPPTVAETDEFLAAWQRDPEAAWGALLDRLLASPHYGERQARGWLDMARYADSNGYSIDAPREIWPWRDWVVNAFNADMPFDRFTVEQLAGDLLPDASQEQRIATGFHRNTQINEEGGVDKEQYRIESVFDRVATTGVVWLGLTIGCAQCHDHKFDPVSQRDYYRLFAFFNDQAEPKLKVGDGPTTLVLEELEQPRSTRILVQGDFTRPAADVEPGTPAVLPPLATPARRPTRLDLARWLVAPTNPLTARVAVNRVWQRLFGRGLVETDSDFGLTGAPPSHPELLDWLALEFQARGWSVKALHRLIMSSRAYRMSSIATAERLAADPGNQWIARQKRLRLDAELVRDVALVASGKFVPTLGGPPVHPPIPDGATAVGQVKRPWPTSTGPDRCRRGLYTFVFRASPPPALAVFDAPDGFSSCTRRNRSNTPLQALTLLNDTAFVELAEALAAVVRDDGIAVAFRRCTGRHPDADEIAVLAALDPADAARVLLNLDETVTRE